MKAEPVEPRLRDFLAAKAPEEGIAAAWLFGSVARGTAGPKSDVDIGVLYSEEPPPGLEGLGLRLEGDIERVLRMPVQLVVLNRAPVDLIQRVLRDGKLLVERDRSRRIAFEILSRKRFWDLEPHLLRYRRLEENHR